MWKKFVALLKRIKKQLTTGDSLDSHSILYIIHITDKTHSCMKMRYVRYIICTIVCRKRIHNDQLTTTYVSAKNSRVISHEYRFSVDNSYNGCSQKIHFIKKFLYFIIILFSRKYWKYIYFIENKKFSIKFKK